MRELKGQGHALSTDFFRNDDFAVFLIGHITVIFHFFNLKMNVLFYICWTIAEILVDF